MIFIFNWATLRFHVDFPGCFHNLKKKPLSFWPKNFQLEDFSDKRKSIFELTAYSFDLTFSLNESSSQALKTGYIFPPSRERPIPPIGFPRGVLCVVLMVEVGQGHLPRKQRYLGVKAHDAHTPCALAWPEGNRLLGKTTGKVLGVQVILDGYI